VLAVAQERVLLAGDPARELVEPRGADLERREDGAHRLEAVDVGDVKDDPRRVVVGTTRTELWKSATRSNRFSTNLPVSASRITSLS
jgi:hypothetical protein